MTSGPAEMTELHEYILSILIDEVIGAVVIFREDSEHLHANLGQRSVRVGWRRGRFRS